MEESPDNYPLTYENLKMFLENAFGSSDPLSEARRYSSDIPGIIKTLYNIYPTLDDPKIKNRITRLRKRLKKQHNSEDESVDTSDNESISSQHSSY